jgi:hypothetical protein
MFKRIKPLSEQLPGWRYAAAAKRASEVVAWGELERGKA